MDSPPVLLLVDWEGLETHNASLVGLSGAVQEDVYDLPERAAALADRIRRWQELQVRPHTR